MVKYRALYTMVHEYAGLQREGKFNEYFDASDNEGALYIAKRNLEIIIKNTQKIINEDKFTGFALKELYRIEEERIY